ncbi:MAG: hypothetical protein Q4D38_05635 [Planctomycetia bacterium]|nr:hypothetical protein [Planctomycetia bacterium]
MRKNRAILLSVLSIVFCLWAASPLVASDEAPTGDASVATSANAKLESAEEGRVPYPKDIERVELGALDKAVARGTEFLLRRQNKNGSWGTPHNTKRINIYAPGSSHDGYRAGTTSLALEALLRVESFLRETSPDALHDEELRNLAARKEEIALSIDRGEKWMFEALPKLRRSSQDVLYNNWGHAYGIHTLRLMYDRPLDLSEEEMEARREKIRDCVRSQLRMLEACECVDGGWCYYDFDTKFQRPGSSTLCFVTATVLVVFPDAQSCGVEVPQRLVKRGIASILRQRFPNGSYAYGEYTVKTNHQINKPAAALSRAQVCLLALDLSGHEGFDYQKEYTDWLNRFIARIGWLEIGRKRPVPHEAWFSVAAYFYYYGHYYASFCIDRLENPNERARFANHLVAINLGLQEKDGSWWDFPLYDYHPYYGTGMVLTTLLNCRDDLL